MPTHEPLLTLIPGPTPVHQGILEALARPTVSHQAPAFVEAYRHCLEALCRVVFAERAQPFVVSGSGTQAMEMGLVNLVAPGERLLVLSQGYFGDRWIQLAQSFGIEVDALQAEWGSAVPVGELERKLEGGRYRAVAMTHVDTSTGTAAPIRDYAARVAGREELLLLDGVCATAGMEERFDDWGLDVLVTGAQKALGAPPGLSLVVASPRAMERRRERDRIPAYSTDFLRWLPVMEDPAKYFSTPPVNEIFAFRQALELVLSEGLEARFERHARTARAIRAGLAALGLALFTREEHLADTLSVVRYPDAVDDAGFRGAMASRQVIVAGALGPVAGKAFRIGHMGNIGPAELFRGLHAIEQSLLACGLRGGFEPGAAVGAAAAVLERASA